MDTSNDTHEITAKDSEMVVFRPELSYQTAMYRERDGQPQRVFFYERLTDNKILQFMEQEAALQMKGSQKLILKQIGCSDGQTYKNFIKNCGLKAGEMVPRSKMREILQGAYNAELEAARGNYAIPMDNNIHFPDNSFPIESRRDFQPVQ